MTPEDFARVLDQLTGQTNYIYYHLMGEPLLHPQLPLFLQMASDRGFRSIITTNGTLLPRHGHELIAAGVHKVSISLHSFEEGSEESYRQYMNGIADFAEAASEAGTIVVLRLWNRGFDNGRNDLALNFLHSRFIEPWTENTKGYRIRPKFFLEWGNRFEWPDKEAPIQGENVFCYGMRDHFGILCDGSVVPCCLDSDGVITLGNIFTEEISDILNSPRARAIVDGFSRRCASEELCRRCGYVQRFSL
jgi:MoaA/NifB/PqqE/SkfB family radical SAM enzyme